MSDLTRTVLLQHPTSRPRDALLAVLDECDRWDNEWAVTNWSVAGYLSPPTAPIRAAINKALGVGDE